LGVQDWLESVGVAYGSGAELWRDGDVTVRRILDGANNAAYQIESGGELYACKLCVANERHRAAREHRALCLLQGAGLDLAPEPLLLDTTCSVLSFPTVIYRWLPGAPLGPPLTPGQLAALLESVQQIHSLRPDQSAADMLPDACFHWFDSCSYLAELRGFLAQYGDWLAGHEPDGPALRGCTRIERRPSRSGVPSAVPVPRRPQSREHGLGRNRPPTLSGLRVRRGDPALDLADLRWHVALEGVTEAQHRWLRERYRRPEGDPGFD
jgi:hypothetical protein